MRPSLTRARLIRLHRWIGLFCAPVLVLILGTGILLALQPLLSPGETRAVVPVDLDRVIAVLDSVERRERVVFAGIEDDRHTLTMFLEGQPAPKSIDLISGTAVPTPALTPPGFWDRVLQAHKNLWFGLGGLVTLATLGMLVLVLVGPFVGRPSTAPGSLKEWHVTTGWFLWPLLALLPVSVVLMKLHPPVVTRDAGAPMALAPALKRASAYGDLSGFDGVQRIRNSTAIVVVRGEAGPVRYVLHPDRIAPLDSPVSRIGRALHQGTWAGPWSGLLNALAGLLDLGLLGLGAASWYTRRRMRQAQIAGAAGLGERVTA